MHVLLYFTYLVSFVQLLSPVFNCSPSLLSSQSQALAHYKGTKHAKKLKSRDTPKSKLKGSSVAKETTNQDIIKSVYSSGVPNSVDSKGLLISDLLHIFGHAVSAVSFTYLLLLLSS